MDGHSHRMWTPGLTFPGFRSQMRTAVGRDLCRSLEVDLGVRFAGDKRMERYGSPMTESESRTLAELGQWTETGMVRQNRRIREEHMPLRNTWPGVVRPARPCRYDAA